MKFSFFVRDCHALLAMTALSSMSLVKELPNQRQRQLFLFPYYNQDSKKKIFGQRIKKKVVSERFFFAAYTKSHFLGIAEEVFR
jgi:hypothetical protein